MQNRSLKKVAVGGVGMAISGEDFLLEVFYRKDMQIILYGSPLLIGYTSPFLEDIIKELVRVLRDEI